MKTLKSHRKSNLLNKSPGNYLKPLLPLAGALSPLTIACLFQIVSPSSTLVKVTILPLSWLTSLARLREYPHPFLLVPAKKSWKNPNTHNGKMKRKLLLKSQRMLKTSFTSRKPSHPSWATKSFKYTMLHFSCLPKKGECKLPPKSLHKNRLLSCSTLNKSRSSWRIPTHMSVLYC